MSARLFVSISGLRDSSLGDARALARDLDTLGVPLSLLVAPRRGHGYRLAQDAETQDWLRERRERGDAIVLGGYDEAATKRRRPEFAAITASEALVRLTAADRLLAELGLRTRLFAPPRWNASPGCLEALPKAGFRLCADLEGIRDLATGEIVRGRVLSLGEGFVAEKWWCRALVAAAGRTARDGGVVRLNVGAKHLARSAPRRAVLDAVEQTLARPGAAAERYEWHPAPHAVAA